MAGLVTGLTSFGSNLVAVPLLAFIYPARDSILIGCISAAIIFLALAIIYARAIRWKETLYLMAGALIGMPPGAWFLKTAGPAALLLAAGFALGLFLIWQFLATRLRKGAKPVGGWFALPMGLLSGILMGGVGMGGPPLVLYVFLRHYGKAAAMATINAASVAMMLCIIPWQYWQGFFTQDLLVAGLLGGAAAVAGILISVPLLRHINIEFFRKLLLLMLTLSALTLLVRGFSVF